MSIRSFQAQKLQGRGRGSLLIERIFSEAATKAQNETASIANAPEQHCEAEGLNLGQC